MSHFRTTLKAHDSPIKCLKMEEDFLQRQDVAVEDLTNAMAGVNVV